MCAVAATSVLGVYADLGSPAAPPWDVIPELGFPWLVLAVLWGRTVTRAPVGAAARAFGICGGLAVWTAWKATAYGTDSVQGFVRYEAMEWLVLAILVGCAGGLAGVWQRRPRVTWQAEFGRAFLPAAAAAKERP